MSLTQYTCTDTTVRYKLFKLHGGNQSLILNWFVSQVKMECLLHEVRTRVTFWAYNVTRSNELRNIIALIYRTKEI